MDKTTILYIDDNLNNLLLFQEYLSDSFNILVESSTHKALDIIEKHNVTVVVSDQRMPEETGLNFLNRVHQHYPDIIKILCTAYFDFNSAVQAVNQGGIFRYILKPYTYEQMVQILESAVREYNLRVENKKLLQELQLKNAELYEALTMVEEQKQKLYNIYAHTSEGIMLIQNNTIVEANNAACRMLDIKHTRNGYVISTEIVNQILKRINASEKNDLIFEKNFFDENNHEKFIEFSITQIHLQQVSTILIFARDISERKENEKKMLEAIIATQENMQRTYACELHDNLGPLLSTIKMYVEWLTHNDSSNKEQILLQTFASIDNSIKQVKSIANQLSPHILQRFGLVHSISNFIEEIKLTNTFDIQFHSNFHERLPPEIELHLYRILMECFSNSFKHSKASKIELYIKHYIESLTIIYTDNGMGFDLEEVKATSKGMGLLNIENRCRLIGASFNIYSEKKQGFKLEIYFNIDF